MQGASSLDSSGQVWDDLVGQHRVVEALRAAAHDCTGCELWEPATQTVFGAGPSSAWLMFVGEQPGDR